MLWGSCLVKPRHCVRMAPLFFSPPTKPHPRGYPSCPASDDCRAWVWGSGFLSPALLTGVTTPSRIAARHFCLLAHFHSITMGSVPSHPAKHTAPGCLLCHLDALGLKRDIKQNDLVFYCQTTWPAYFLDSSHRWPPEGTLGFLWDFTAFATVLARSIRSGLFCTLGMS